MWAVDNALHYFCETQTEPARKCHEKHRLIVSILKI